MINIINTAVCYIWKLRKVNPGNSLAVQWLGLRAFTAEDVGSIPGRGTKVPQAVRCSQKKINLIKFFKKEK